MTKPSHGTITASALTGSDIDCGSGGTDCSDVFGDGAEVTLTATPDAGYSVTGWTGCTPNASTCGVTMDRDRTVGATFADTPPDPPSITSPSSGTVRTSTIGGSTAVSFVKADSETSSFRCRVDNSSATGATTCSSPWSTGPLATGFHTVYVWAADAAGNVSAAASRSFGVVNLAETVLSGTPAEGSVTRSTATSFTASSSVAGTTLECSLDPGDFALYGPCRTDFGPLADGAHTLYARAGVKFQAVTYFDTTPAKRSWVVDTHAPDTKIATKPAAATRETTAAFTLQTGTDPAPGTALTFECRLDTAAFAPCDPSSVSYTGLAEGVHTFRARATDAAGNMDASPAAYSWTVDTTAPQTSILAKPKSLTNATTAAFTFASSEPGSTFRCKLDAEPALSPCPPSYPGLAEGSHTLEVRATDPAGNEDATPASYAWTVDTTPPDTTLTAGPDDGSTSVLAHQPFAYRFTNPEPGGGSFVCELDAAAMPCDGDGGVFGGQVRTSALAPGLHVFQVAAVDEAGNADPSPEIRTWTTAGLRISDARVTEGSSSKRRHAVFRLTLPTAGDADVTVTYSTVNGSARAGSDFTAVDRSVTIPAGSTAKTVRIAIVGDRRDEPSERFSVEVSSSTAAVADVRARGTIADDDPVPSLRIGNAKIREGDHGTRAVRLRVRLSAASGRKVEVRYATRPGSAKSSKDFRSAHGRLTFLPGQTSKRVSIDVRGDRRDEPNEAFSVRISRALHAHIADSGGTATIRNDD